MSLPLTTDEAKFVLKELISREQQRLQLLMKPYMQELVDISYHKPPQPVTLEDGRVVRYVGPTTEQITGKPYTAPLWLRELAMEDPEIRHHLGRYRERNG